MHDQQEGATATYQATLADVKREANRPLGSVPERDYVKIADQFRRLQKPMWGYNILEPLQERYQNDVYFNFVLALICRDRQDMECANSAISTAASIEPNQPDIAFARAQFAFEAWQPSVSHFRAAERLAPDNLAIKKNLALALIAEGESEKALKQLETTLEAHPDWLDGHQQLASIKLTIGYPNVFSSLQQVCAIQADKLNLRMAWFYLLAQAKDWESARQALYEVPAQFKSEAPVEMADIYLRAETGGILTNDELTGQYAQKTDPGFDLCLTRYHLRSGEPEEAEKIASRHLGGPSERLFWPYLSICWRMSGDPRFLWLEHNAEYASIVDLPVSNQQLSGLADVLRSLHKHQKPYLEQSVNGGTQTDRNLFFNPDERIQWIRRLILQAVSDYADQLPQPEEAHPLLGQTPDEPRFAGAWSVVLGPQGYHSTHTHVQGWLSSAFYVALPDDMGTSPAGYLSFGNTPPELGLNLKPIKEVQPKAGRLVLFPSYYWHSTIPFAEGERQTIAFDIACS